MLKFRRSSLTLVIAIVAVLVAASGGAWAASVGLDNGPAAGAAKKKKRPKVNGGPRGPQGPQGPPGPTGPSNGFVKSQLGATPLTAGTDTTVVQLSLTPGSSYIVTAATELGNSSGAANLVSCTLLENNNPIGGGSASLPGLNVFAQTVTLTAATTGGTMKLTCNPAAAGQARNRVITAIKVGALETQ